MMTRPLIVVVMTVLLAVAVACGSLGGLSSSPQRPAATETAPSATPGTGESASSTPRPSPSPEAPAVAVAGDIACAPTAKATKNTCVHKAVSDAILGDTGLSAVLTLGDSQYEEGSLEQYQKSYDKTWGRFKRITYPVPGNHDYRTPGAAGYFDYFGAAAGHRSKGYYSFDIGAWHFVALNSERDIERGGKQVKWLKADLKRHDNRCTAAFWHRPRWSSGEKHGDYPGVAPFVEALYQADADLILVGHEHNYERFEPLDPRGRPDDQRGIVQIVAGLGGKTQYPVAGRNTTVASNDTSYGYLRMELHEQSADIRFVPVVDSFRDAFTLTCH